MGDPAASLMAEAMNRLWNKHLLQIQERVATLLMACEHLANNTLTKIEQHQAAAEAHKLAGILGTFGLTDGTKLAREAEALLEGPMDGVAASRLITIAEQLRALIATRT
jgi:HPt (histidine-containing phosphotransfer) domain-containing protein